MSDTTVSKAPWHLWAVGVLAVLWNGFGCFDYAMSQLQGADYMRSVGMTDAQIGHLLAAPAWMDAVWAIGVWGGAVGAILLLMKNKLAVPVFVASLAAYVLSLVYAYVIAPTPEAGAGMMIMQAVIFVFCVFFVWYASQAKRRGLLR
jgi:hypothetical protein